MTTFRLATINVHSFNSPQIYNNNISQLTEILKRLDLDLIAVEEIQDNENWSNFCKLLSFPHSIFGAGSGKYFGNGLASRYPILTHSNQQSSSPSSCERRSMLQCRLDGDHSFIKDRIFAVTHLDHMNEDDRIDQLYQFNPSKHNIDILMGDMNALTRDDYSDVYYQNSVLGIREESRWEKPRFDLTQLITNQWSFEDAFKQINPHLKDEQVVTCRFGTRIDYIYIRPRVNDDWILKECSIVDSEKATDHNIVLAVFERKQKK
jgi:endonuclease/exonuclease/phosphatase family metal-dependent hydrolase